MTTHHFSQHSTGPRSEAGKAASSRNAIRHGLTCTRFRFTEGENEAEYELLKSALLQEHRPATITEALLVERMAQSFWMVQRVLRVQSLAETTQREHSLLCRYQATHDRAFHVALKQLLALQETRKAEERGEPELKLRKRQLDNQLKERKLARLQQPAAKPSAAPPHAPPVAA